MSKALLTDLQTGKEYLLEGDVSIGRHTGNNIVIPDHTVSGTHAKITNVGSSWYISDCNSRNGVEMNGFRVPTEGKLGLRNGCTLKLGDSFLSFTADENVISDYLSRNGKKNEPQTQKNEPITQTTPRPIQPISQGGVGSNGRASSEQTGNHKKSNRDLIVVLCSAVAFILLVFGWCLSFHFIGNERMTANDYPGAVKAYKKDFLFSSQQCTELAMQEGERLFSEEKYSEACEYFKIAGEKGNDRWVDAVYEDARIALFNENDPEKAITLLKQINNESRVRNLVIKDESKVQNLLSLAMINENLNKYAAEAKEYDAGSWRKDHSKFISNARVDKMVGEYKESTDHLIGIKDLQDFYSYCGTEPAGKILIIAKRTNYPYRTESYAVLLDMMHLLPKEYCPKSLAEVEYIVLVKYDYENKGNYMAVNHSNAPPTALREKGNVTVIQLPDKATIYNSDTVYGKNPPEWTSADLWESGGAPNMGEHIYQAIVLYII